MRADAPFADPVSYLLRNQPDVPMMFFCPRVLQATARRFQTGFDGLVSYAVKANPSAAVLDNLVAAGLRAFDVASPREMAAVRAACPQAVLHYHNPVRSRAEVAEAVRLGVAAYSVDDLAELDKLSPVPRGTEISVRLALKVKGGAYDFGSKFGAAPEAAVELLRAVAERGYRPAMTFHPGTQCSDPAAWEAYIAGCAAVAREAGVTLERLNVGGGFAARRGADSPDLEAIFTRIADSARRHFAVPPALVCEPGRAMVADAFCLAARVKALRPDGAVFLNDGLYGGLSEMRDIAMTDRLRVLSPLGAWRRGAPRPRVVFGPTCDSVDRMPGLVALPGDIAEDDYVLFDGMGAYSVAIASAFNGYGLGDAVTVSGL